MQIALFHSVLGVRPGIHDAAAVLRNTGHEVLVVDLYDGKVFDDYLEAVPFAMSLGFPQLMQRADEAAQTLPDGYVAAGFSNGGAMAEFVALRGNVAGVLLFSGALPVTMLGAQAWPTGTPAQIHYMADDPFKTQENVDALVAEITAADAKVEVFDYPGGGHLFTDESLPEEYDAQSASLLWNRTLEFLDKLSGADA